MLYAVMPTSSSAIAVGGKMTRGFSAPLPATCQAGPSNHKKMKKFRMPALEWVQRYRAGRGFSRCSPLRAEDDPNVGYGGGRTVLRVMIGAAGQNSEPELVTTAARKRASDEE